MSSELVQNWHDFEVDDCIMVLILRVNPYDAVQRYFTKLKLLSALQPLFKSFFLLGFSKLKMLLIGKGKKLPWPTFSGFRVQARNRQADTVNADLWLTVILLEDTWIQWTVLGTIFGFLKRKTQYFSASKFLLQQLSSGCHRTDVKHDVLQNGLLSVGKLMNYTVGTSIPLSVSDKLLEFGKK